MISEEKWFLLMKAFNSINLFWKYPQEREREIENMLVKPICVSYPTKAKTWRAYQSNANFEFFE